MELTLLEVAHVTRSEETAVQDGGGIQFRGGAGGSTLRVEPPQAQGHQLLVHLGETPLHLLWGASRSRDFTTATAGEGRTSVHHTCTCMDEHTSHEHTRTACVCTYARRKGHTCINVHTHAHICTRVHITERSTVTHYHAHEPFFAQRTLKDTNVCIFTQRRKNNDTQEKHPLQDITQSQEIQIQAQIRHRAQGGGGKQYL